MKAHDVGRAGEKEACRYLQEHGYDILACNFQRAKGKIIGEIDIVAQKGETVAFVEVKTRQSEVYGLPCEAVTKSKQQKIIKAAYTYIIEKGLDANYRFDVIEVLHNGKKVTELRHLPNAFTL